MKIDIVESMWGDLETAFKNSKAANRRKFVEQLVGFTGESGAVKSLESMLRMDLDNRSESVERYNAICNMLETAESWLIENSADIADLNLWLEQLANSKTLDTGRLSVVYTPNSGKQLLENIQFGYVLPGLYGDAQSAAFDTKIQGYYYFNELLDLKMKLPLILKVAGDVTNVFDRQVVHVLNKKAADKSLSFPCVFVDSSLLRKPIYKYKKVESVVKKNVKVLENGDTTVDLDYDYGLISISTATTVPVYVVRCDNEKTK